MDRTAGAAFEIREAESSDYEHIDRVAAAAWQCLRSGYDADRWDSLLSAISKMSGLSAQGTLIVAADRDDLLGAVCYIAPGHSGDGAFPRSWAAIRMLVVKPESRGRGIGRRLTEECIARARRDRATCVGLHTSRIMTVALPMYLRMGFVEDGLMPDIAGAPYRRYRLAIA